MMFARYRTPYQNRADRPPERLDADSVTLQGRSAPGLRDGNERAVALPTFHLSSDQSFWDIGSGNNCAIRVPAGAGQVAQLIKRGPRLFIQNLGTADEVCLNGKVLGRRARRELSVGDDLSVAGTAVVIDPTCFRNGIQLGVDTSRLRYTQRVGRSQRQLCDGLFLRARPGTFTAIVGPVGCGKTTFLDLLAGEKEPTIGRVVMGDEDLRLDPASQCCSVGYACQLDRLIPELTVRQSLHSRLQLRFPDMAAPVREQRIRDGCRKAGLAQDRIERFLGTTIGSGESGQRGLSGGERKLACIVHELLLQPPVLILDEPTSGLSSQDAEELVRNLKQLAFECGTTVIATLHQPTPAAFECFDDLLAITQGGALAYYGPASGAVEYFEQAFATPCLSPGTAAEFILNRLCEFDHAEPHLNGFRPQLLRRPLPDDAPPAPPELTSAEGGDQTGTLRCWASQVGSLVWRQGCVTLADRANLLLTFGQVPLVALLLLLAFFGFQKDDPVSNQLFEQALHFTGELDRHINAHEPFPLDRVVREGRLKAPSGGLSVLGARRRAAIYFILVAASVWLGVLGGCREVVAEKPVLRHERRIGVRVGPYLAAKTVVLGAQTGVQTGLMVILVTPILLRLPGHEAASVWGVLWLTAVASATVGLMISSFAPTPRFALTAVPLLMIPQMILGGMLRPEIDLPPGQVAPRILSWLTMQRWGFEAVLQRDPFARSGVMFMDFTPESPSPLAPLDWVHFRPGSLPGCFFEERTGLLSKRLPAACLFLGGLLSLLVSRWHLQRCLLWPRTAAQPPRIEDRFPHTLSQPHWLAN